MTFFFILLLLFTFAKNQQIFTCFVGKVAGRVTHETLNSLKKFFAEPLGGHLSSLLVSPLPSTFEEEKWIAEFLKIVGGNRIFQSEKTPKNGIEEVLMEEGFDIYNEKNIFFFLEHGPFQHGGVGDAFCGSRLWTYKALDLCYRHLLSLEKKNGRRFDWVIRSRPDYLWTSPPVPPSLLPQFKDWRMVWIPQGEDYGGVNDRFALMEREVADIYFALWQAFTSGQALHLVQQAPRYFSPDFPPRRFDVEHFLALWLALFSWVGVGRIPPFGYLYCLRGSNASLAFENTTLLRSGQQSWWGACNPKLLEEMKEQYPCTKPYKKSQLEIFNKIFFSKYPSEFFGAHKMADCLSFFGNTWTSKAVEVCWCLQLGEESWEWPQDLVAKWCSSL